MSDLKTHKKNMLEIFIKKFDLSWLSAGQPHQPVPFSFCPRRRDTQFVKPCFYIYLSGICTIVCIHFLYCLVLPTMLLCSMCEGVLRIDKGSRCILRYSYILLITLMAFVLSEMY